MVYTLNIKEFHESTSKELDIIKDRVRNLIGGANWGEEGRYKEAILKNVIRRFLPKNYDVGSGFVVKRDDNNTIIESSTQMDLIVYDTSFPILFSEGILLYWGPKLLKGLLKSKQI